jgi:hypothetical protein
MNGLKQDHAVKQPTRARIYRVRFNVSCRSEINNQVSLDNYYDLNIKKTGN